jgi:hypothetical protein
MNYRSSEDTRETYEEQSADERELVPTEMQTSHSSRSRYYANRFEYRIWPMLRRITACDVLFEMLYCGGLSRNHPFKSVANR